MKINLRKIIIGISGLLCFTIIFLFISRWDTKHKTIEIYRNGKYTKAVYKKNITPAKGAVTAICSFIVNNKEYLSKPSLASFPNSSPTIGKNYYIIYNSMNPDESICFLNLEVPDSLNNLSGELNKIPIENYQKKVDSFIMATFLGGVNKYFPPYYSREEIERVLRK